MDETFEMDDFYPNQNPSLPNERNRHPTSVPEPKVTSVLEPFIMSENPSVSKMKVPQSSVPEPKVTSFNPPISEIPSEPWKAVSVVLLGTAFALGGYCFTLHQENKTAVAKRTAELKVRKVTVSEPEHEREKDITPEYEHAVDTAMASITNGPQKNKVPALATHSATAHSSRVSSAFTGASHSSKSESPGLSGASHSVKGDSPGLSGASHSVKGESSALSGASHSGKTVPHTAHSSKASSASHNSAPGRVCALHGTIDTSKVPASSTLPVTSDSLKAVLINALEKGYKSQGEESDDDTDEVQENV